MNDTRRNSSLYLAGTGNVGSALAHHFLRRKKRCAILPPEWENDPPKSGYLFLAVPDTEVERILRETYSKIPRGLRIVHFAAGITVTRERLHLLHPFASITPHSDLSRILCLWCGGNDPTFRRFLTAHRFRFLYRAARPGPGYHTAAVLAGNFTQYLYAAAAELLEREKLSPHETAQLLTQLIDSSLDGIREHGLAGLTGPAARGDRAVVRTETAFLADASPQLAAVYRKLSELIAQAVRNDKILP